MARNYKLYCYISLLLVSFTCSTISHVLTLETKQGPEEHVRKSVDSVSLLFGDHRRFRRSNDGKNATVPALHSATSWSTTNGTSNKSSDVNKSFTDRVHLSSANLNCTQPWAPGMKRTACDAVAGNATDVRPENATTDVRSENDTTDVRSENDTTDVRSENELNMLQLPPAENVGIGARNGVLMIEEKPPNHANNKDGKEYPSCRRPARCEPLNYTSCFGATLSYKQTSLDLVNGAVTQRDIQEQLDRWQGLRNVPKCWAVVQALLCSIYMPRCENGLVDLPSHEICRATRTPCRVVESTLGWPDFLRCSSEKRFPVLCKTDTRELRFNTNGRCQAPLVITDSSANWYDGWEGCGLQCHNPLFTEEEHKEIHNFIGVVGCFCFLASLFTVLTFAIDWKSANKYPALIIFYISWCYLISCIGWLAQFTPSARADIVCRRDGTLRKAEPTYGENLSCVIVFVMVYYFLMASVIWFDMLAYSWYVSFKALGKIREAIEAKTAYFHLVAWSLPLVLTIAILALAQIDGDSISGICFVGHVSWSMRVGFVLIPISISIIIGGFFLVRGITNLLLP